MFNDSYKYFTYGSYICSFTSMTTYVFLVLADIFVSLFIQITVEMVCTCVSIHSANTNDTFDDSTNTLYLVAIFLLLHLWQLKCSLFGRHYLWQMPKRYKVTNICIRQQYLFFHIYDHFCSPCLATYLFFIIYTNTFFEMCIHVYLRRHVSKHNANVQEDLNDSQK